MEQQGKQEGAQGSATTARRVILAVDDSETMRSMVEQTLRLGDYDVVLAEDGHDALRRFNETRVDMVITDVNMPNMDGITLIRELRKLDEDIPILTLTTESEQELKQKGAEAGADGWIVKPLHPAQLLDLIKQILE